MKNTLTFLIVFIANFQSLAQEPEMKNYVRRPEIDEYINDKTQNNVFENIDIYSYYIVDSLGNKIGNKVFQETVKKYNYTKEDRIKYTTELFDKKFSSGLAVVEGNKFIDMNGNEPFKNDFCRVKPFENGIAFVTYSHKDCQWKHINPKQAIINTKGEPILKFKEDKCENNITKGYLFDEIGSSLEESFSGYTILKFLNKGKNEFFLMTRNGEKLIPIKKQNSEVKYVYVIDEKYFKTINDNNESKIFNYNQELKYEGKNSAFSFEKFEVENSKIKYSLFTWNEEQVNFEYLDEDFKVIINPMGPKFIKGKKSPYFYSEGNKKKGVKLLNNYGDSIRVFAEPIYDEITDLGKQQCARYKKDGQWGYIDAKTNLFVASDLLSEKYVDEKGQFKTLKKDEANKTEENQNGVHFVFRHMKYRNTDQHIAAWDRMDREEDVAYAKDQAKYGNLQLRNEFDSVCLGKGSACSACSGKGKNSMTLGQTKKSESVSYGDVRNGQVVRVTETTTTARDNTFSTSCNSCNGTGRCSTNPGGKYTAVINQHYSGLCVD